MVELWGGGSFINSPQVSTAFLSVVVGLRAARIYWRDLEAKVMILTQSLHVFLDILEPKVKTLLVKKKLF